MNSIMASLRDFVAAVREINAKYKTPRIQMTPMVRASLLALRLYLLFMVVLLLYKFVTIVTGTGMLGGNP